MTALVVMRLRISLRRLVRGRPGTRRWMLRVAAIGLLVVLVEVLTVWLATRPPEGGPIAMQLAGPVAVVLAAAGGGAIALVVEASRDQLGESTGSHTLPLTRVQRAVVDGAPGVLLTLALAALTTAPVAGLLVASGRHPAAALALALSAVCLGLAVAAVVIAAATVLMPGARWSPVRLPLAMLVAGGLLVVGVAHAITVVTSRTVDAGAALLVLPLLVRSALGATALPAALTAGIVIAALVAIVVVVPLATSRGQGTRTAVVRFGWRGRGGAGQLAADLAHVVRSPLLLANGAAVLLLLVGAVVAVLTVDRRIADALTPLLVVVGCALAGSIVRLQRGLLPRIRTPQQLVGYSVESFVASQLAAGLVLLALGLAPLALLAIRAPLDPAATVLDLATGALVAYALAVLSSWAIPVESSTGAAQALAAFVTSVVTVSLVAALVQLPGETAGAVLLIVTGATGFAALAAWRLEAARWRPRHPFPYAHTVRDERGDTR